METTGNFVCVAIEFTARVENGENNFGGGALFGGMHVHGNATAIVHNGDRIIGMDGDIDFVGETRHGFVDRVVDYFPDKMVQSHFPSGADVHGGTQTDGFEPAKDLNGFGVVLVTALARHCLFVAHFISLALNPPCVPTAIPSLEDFAPEQRPAKYRPRERWINSICVKPGKA